MSEQTPSNLIEQGKVCFDRGDFRGAIARYEEAATQAHARGEDSNELYALSELSISRGNLGDYHKMVETATHLLVRVRQLQSESYEMIAILRLTYPLGNLDVRGHWGGLKSLLLEGLATTRRLEDHFHEVEFLMRLGSYAVGTGELELGFTWLQEALNAISPDINIKGQHSLFLLVYSRLSALMYKKREYGEAVRYAEMTLREAHEAGNPAFVSFSKLILAKAERGRGEKAEALRLVEEVLSQARERRWKVHEQRAEYLRGKLERELGHPEIAEIAARQSLKLAQEMKIKEEEVLCLLSLGQILLALRRTQEARDMLLQARRLSQERDYKDHFDNAERLLRSLNDEVAKP